MLRVLTSTVKCFAGPQAVRAFSSESVAVSGHIVDQTRDFSVVDDVLGAINKQITQDTYSRLFAVVYLHGKQFKVTAEDIITVRAHVPLDVGETIRLNKVLLAASTDFTLIGKPLIDQDLVRVYATVIEKTLGHEYRVFNSVQRSRYKRSYFHRDKLTMFRINGIELVRPLEH